MFALRFDPPNRVPEALKRLSNVYRQHLNGRTFGGAAETKAAIEALGPTVGSAVVQRYLLDLDEVDRSGQ